MLQTFILPKLSLAISRCHLHNFFLSHNLINQIPWCFIQQFWKLIKCKHFHFDPPLNELSSISRSNIRSADRISISRSNIRSADRITISRSNIQSADQISISRSNIRSADRITIWRSNIRTTDRISILRSDIRSADQISI